MSISRQSENAELVYPVEGRGGALLSRGPRLTSEFLHFRVLMWEPAHIINGHVRRTVKNFRHTKPFHLNVDLRNVVCCRYIQLSSSFDFVRSLILSEKNLYVISVLKSSVYGHLLNFSDCGQSYFSKIRIEICSSKL